MPLHGGVMLDMSGYNGFGWVRDGVGRAQAGIRLADFDRQARPHGWELRWLPSTFRSATLGGLFGGGFGGAGSITYGPVAAAGNVLGVRVMTVEPEPRVLELRSPDAMLLHHVYGTNGIVLELEVALGAGAGLARMHRRLRRASTPALEFASALARRAGTGQEGSLLLRRAGARLHDRLAELPAGRPPCGDLPSSPSRRSAALRAGRDASAAASRTARPAAEVQASNRTLLEYTWNHTTLVALKLRQDAHLHPERVRPAAPPRAGQGARARARPAKC